MKRIAELPGEVRGARCSDNDRLDTFRVHSVIEEIGCQSEHPGKSVDVCSPSDHDEVGPEREVSREMISILDIERAGLAFTFELRICIGNNKCVGLTE